MSETKQSNLNTEKKYVSLSNILSDKSLAGKEAEKKPTVNVETENKLVDLDKLLSDFDISVDEKLKKLDESEKARQKNALQSNKILESINWNYSFKNRQLPNRKSSRKIKNRVKFDVLRPRLKRKLKKTRIRIKKFSMIQNLVNFKIKLIPENIELAKSKSLRALVKDGPFRDAIKKKKRNRNVSRFSKTNFL